MTTSLCVDVAQVIFVRDNIVVRAGGDDRGDKPFIAKIASIWRETAGWLGSGQHRNRSGHGVWPVTAFPVGVTF